MRIIYIDSVAFVVLTPLSGQTRSEVESPGRAKVLESPSGLRFALLGEAGERPAPRRFLSWRGDAGGPGGKVRHNVLDPGSARLPCGRSGQSLPRRGSEVRRTLRPRRVA